MRYIVQTTIDAEANYNLLPDDFILHARGWGKQHLRDKCSCDKEQITQLGAADGRLIFAQKIKSKIWFPKFIGFNMKPNADAEYRCRNAPLRKFQKYKIRVLPPQYPAHFLNNSTYFFNDPTVSQSFNS